jgi:hypothetical protein
LAHSALAGLGVEGVRLDARAFGRVRLDLGNVAVLTIAAADFIGWRDHAREGADPARRPKTMPRSVARHSVCARSEPPASTGPGTGAERTGKLYNLNKGKQRPATGFA